MTEILCMHAEQDLPNYTPVWQKSMFSIILLKYTYWVPQEYFFQSWKPDVIFGKPASLTWIVLIGSIVVNVPVSLSFADALEGERRVQMHIS